MNVKIFLLSIIIILVAAIVYLFVQIFTPPTRISYDFDDIIKMSKSLRNSLNEINISYDVNLTISGRKLQGRLDFFKNKTTEEVLLSDSIKDYKSYLWPDIFSLANQSERKDYSGDLEFSNRSCWAIIIEPNETCIACFKHGVDDNIQD